MRRQFTFAHNLHKLLRITSENVRPLTHFMKKYSSYNFYWIMVGVFFQRNSFIREDGAFCFVMHQSIPAVPNPPPPTRALAFFKKIGRIPRGGDEKRGQNAPPPGSSPSYTSADFFINQWIKRSTFQYFNAMVLKTSRTTLRASLFWLYLFLYILFSTKF